MSKGIQASIQEFISAVEKLQADAPYARRDGWVATTKDQWIGWLSQYDTPGYYNRKGTGYDAKYSYNHVQNHQMLLWLLEAAGLDKATLDAARINAEAAKTMASRAGAVRKLVPWERAVELLWPAGR